MARIRYVRMNPIFARQEGDRLLLHTPVDRHKKVTVSSFFRMLTSGTLGHTAQ